MGGILLALTAYGVWGFIPIYFKSLSSFTPLGILAGRVCSACVLLVILLTCIGKGRVVWQHFCNRFVLSTLLVSACLLAANWLLFIVGVAQNEIRQCSLGYFISPLVTVCLGAILFREPLGTHHWWSLLFAFLGILGEVIRVQGVPWIALGLALSFAGYAVARRITTADSLTGLTVEVILMCPVAVVFLLVGTSHHQSLSIRDWYLMAGSGLVTAIPLVTYVAAARRITFVTLGFLQYIAPSLQLAVAVWVYGEPFPRERMVSFALIGLSVAIFLFGVLFIPNPTPHPNPAKSA